MPAAEVFHIVTVVAGVAVGSVIGYMFTDAIARLKTRARFDAMIARQRQRCRPLHDCEEFTFDDSLDRMTLQVLERAREEVAHQ